MARLHLETLFEKLRDHQVQLRQCHASFSLLLMEGSANAPYLEALQRKEKVCHSVCCESTGRSNSANALEKDDVEES